MPVQLKFAMLKILAGRPDGRARIDELRRELEAAADGPDMAGHFSELEGVDVLQAGLVASEDQSLHITDAGRSVLRALEALGEQSAEAEQPDHSQSLKAIDELIGTELRLKIFDLGLRAPGETPNLEPLEDEIAAAETEMKSEAETQLEEEPEAIVSESTEKPRATQTSAGPVKLMLRLSLYP